MLIKKRNRSLIKTIGRSKRTLKRVIRDRIATNTKLLERYTEAEIEYIIKTFFLLALERCIVTQEGIQFPYGAGILIIGKFKPKPGSKAEYISKFENWQRNLHDPYICKWTWKADKFTYWGNKIPSRFYRWVPSRKARYGLRYAILNGIDSSRFFHLVHKNK